MVKYHMGIDVGILKEGTSIYVNTANSLYHIHIVKGFSIIVHGGKYFPKPQEAYFIGSEDKNCTTRTIEQGMKMKIMTKEGKIIITSTVEKAKISGTNWQYEMEWD